MRRELPCPHFTDEETEIQKDKSKFLEVPQLLGRVPTERNQAHLIPKPKENFHKKCCGGKKIIILTFWPHFHFLICSFLTLVHIATNFYIIVSCTYTIYVFVLKHFSLFLLALKWSIKMYIKLH